MISTAVPGQSSAELYLRLAHQKSVQNQIPSSIRIPAYFLICFQCHEYQDTTSFRSKEPRQEHPFAQHRILKFCWSNPPGMTPGPAAPTPGDSDTKAKRGHTVPPVSDLAHLRVRPQAVWCVTHPKAVRDGPTRLGRPSHCAAVRTE